MKKLVTCIAYSSLIFALACNKDKKKQYSTWVVNGNEPFTTNDVEYSVNKSGPHLASLYNENGFSFSNNGAGTAYNAFTEGFHLLSSDTVSNNPEFLHAFFLYHYMSYRPMPNHNDSIEVSSVNSKVRYKLYPSWFVNSSNANDSILIEGTFNEP